MFKHRGLIVLALVALFGLQACVAPPPRERVVYRDPAGYNQGGGYDRRDNGVCRTCGTIRQIEQVRVDQQTTATSSAAAAVARRRRRSARSAVRSPATRSSRTMRARHPATPGAITWNSTTATRPGSANTTIRVSVSATAWSSAVGATTAASS